MPVRFLGEDGWRIVEPLADGDRNIEAFVFVEFVSDLCGGVEQVVSVSRLPCIPWVGGRHVRERIEQHVAFGDVVDASIFYPLLKVVMSRESVLREATRD